tara:strand:+ start:1174 stop:1410 length:237 start_codon:yes stop_codon:yes gene_type:complete
MSDLTKLTKAQLITLIKEKEEYNFENFKEQLNLEYETEQEWIDYIKKLQDLNAERLNDCEELIKLRTDIRTWTANKLM